jgi:hypothetical protein
LSTNVLQYHEKIVIQLIENFFKFFGIKYSSHDSASLWMIRYFNFRLKYIGVERRTVFFSKQICDKIIQNPLQKNFDKLAGKVMDGADLNPYQSKKSFDSDFHDDLFNDWGIHHLHLSNSKINPTDFFYDRTGPLLFVKFTETAAYFIDIQHHKDKNVWSNTNLIRILQNSWPTLLKDREVPNTKFNPDFSDEDIGTLRRKGYTFGINVDNKSYMMLGDGYSSSGDNGRSVSKANEVWRWIGKNKDFLLIDEDFFVAGLKQKLSID